MKLWPALSIIAAFSPAVWSAPAADRSRDITAWPVVYHHAEQDRAETDVLWPLWRYEREKTWTRYAIRPFLFSTESDPEKDYRKTSVLWPLSIYRRQAAEGSFHIFPIYWHGTSPESSYNTFFPVYWEGCGKDYSYRHFWPIFGTYQRGETFTEYSTLYPFFRYGSDSASGERDVHAFWPLFNFHSDAGYLSHRFLPLYWYERGEDRAGGFVFPYYWKNAPGQTAKGIVPIWYSSQEPGLRTDLVLPFYYNREDAEGHLRLITPLYFDRQTADSELQTLLPVYLNYEKQDFGVRIGLPFFLWYQNGPFTFSSIFPLYFHSADVKEESAFTYYFPVYGRYQQGDAVTRHFLLFPLYAKFQDEALGVRGWDVAWPLFHYETSESTQSIRALPFYWKTRSPDYGLTLAFPLYGSFVSGETRYSHLVPFYGVHTKGDWYTKRFVLGPLFIDTRDARAGRTQQDILFPVFSRSSVGDRERSWLFPIYFHQSEPDKRLTLASLALLPPYYVQRDTAEHELFHVWPFYGESRAGSYQEYSSLWPLIRSGEDPARGLDLTQVLLYYQKKEQDTSLTAVFPLWWHKSNPDSTVDGSLLLHRYEQNEARQATEWSFFWLGLPEISLIRFERDPSLVRHRFFPLYSYSSNSKTDVLDWTILWPLFSYGGQGEYARETGFLWKVISYERKDQQTSDFRFLWRLFRKSKTETTSTLEFNPFYYHESEQGKGSYWAILGGMLGRETSEDGQSRMRWLWIF